MSGERAKRIVAERRRFLRGAVSAAGLALAWCAAPAAGRAPKRGEHEEAEVTPGEDLMQEHGVLERVLLVYEEAARRIEHGESLDLGVVTRGAAIVRRFVEDYHERLEEQYVFPRLQKPQQQVELVATLLRQHQRGREATDEIVRRVGAGGGAELVPMLRGFSAMYRPHAAREDTVLFPAFRGVVGRSAYRELGEQFENEEHQRFGEHGFESTVVEVAQLEVALGIDQLKD